MTNDIIKEVLKTLKEQLAYNQRMAEIFHEDFKRHEAKVLGLKHSISELEHFLENKHGQKQT